MNSINTSFTSPYLNQAQQHIEQSYSRISSGRAVQTSADDAAGLAIASGFRTDISGFDQAARNSADGVSLAQTATGALESVSSNLIRIRELAVQAGNGTLNDSDRQALNTEAKQLRGEITRITESSTFNGVPLLSRQDSLNIQTGPNADDTIAIQTADLRQTFRDTGFDALDISTQAGAEAALSGIDNVQTTTLQLGADYGAVINRFDSVVSSLSQQGIQAEAARSRIEDTDVARESANMVRNQLLTQTSISVQGQANQQASLVLKLLS